MDVGDIDADLEFVSSEQFNKLETSVTTLKSDVSSIAQLTSITELLTKNSGTSNPGVQHTTAPQPDDLGQKLMDVDEEVLPSALLPDSAEAGDLEQVSFVGDKELGANVLDEQAPIRTYRPKSSSHTPCPWKLPALHDAILLRNAAHRHWRASPTDMDLRTVFTSARAEAKQMSRRLRAQNLLTRSQANARLTWKTINELSGRTKTSTPPFVSIAALSEQFSGVVSDPSRPVQLSLPCGPSPRDPLRGFQATSVEEVFTFLVRLDARKAEGSDSIPAFILKHCAAALAPSLSILINASLSSGIVPVSLKIANVLPLFKSGDKNASRNYRPISLLPIASKILEKIVHKRLCDFLQTHSLLPANQFAYRPQHSMEDALTLAMDRYLSSADHQLHTGAVLVDMSKAFDKVRHQLMIQDLFALGVSSTALRWFASYFTDRRQRVVLASGQCSGLTACECGVPQGSVLGPLLFSLYTMDVHSVTSPAHSQLFADDILLDTASRSVATLNQVLSVAVSNLADYLHGKGLVLNPDKTQVLAIEASRRSTLELNVNCNGTPLTQTTTARFLGLQIDSCLRWDVQVSSIVRKTSQKLTTLRTIRPSLSERQSLLFYSALILPDMLYGSNAFFSALTAQQQHQLAVLDKRWVRCVADLPFPSHTTPAYTRLSLTPVIERAKCKLRFLMHRVHTSSISPLLKDRVALQPPSNTRGNDNSKYVVPLTR